MKTFLIIKKGVIKNITNPSISITYDEYLNTVESNLDHLIWEEDTEWGKKWHADDPNCPKKSSVYLNFDNKNRDNYFVHIKSPSYGRCYVQFDYGLTYEALKLVHKFAEDVGCNLWETFPHKIITKSYLKALRVKEENRGIKLSNEQSQVLTLVEEQCRWYHIPSDGQAAILQCFPIKPEINEAEITEVIEDVQLEDQICMASIPGHTILFGFHLPYINYADEADYKSCPDHTSRLKEILNRLSKTFGSAEFFEYREDDPDMMRMVLSKKGNFAYASLNAEGEHSEEFGTSKRSIAPDEKHYWKTVKKLGMLPTDLLTYVMKQQLPVKIFQQSMYWKWAHEE